MKTRQATWFAAVGHERLLAEVETCSSDFLQELLRSMDDQQRASLVRLQTELVGYLKEEIGQKLSFWHELPYAIVKIYWGEIVGGSLEAAQHYARQCLARYDQVLGQGRGNTLHRVAHHVLGPSACRQQLEAFVAGSLPLNKYPDAYFTVKRYCMIPIVGRRVETVHAEIKRIGKVAPCISPP